MSISIRLQDKIILRCKNSIFSILHETIMKIIEKKKLKLNKLISYVLDELDQNIWGLGMVSLDISNYLKTKKDVVLFAQLVNESIHSLEKNNVLADFASEALKNFHQELIKYYE